MLSGGMSTSYWGGGGVPTTFVTYFSCTAYSFLEKRDRNLHRVTQGCTEILWRVPWNNPDKRAQLIIRNKIWVCDHLVDMHAFQLPCFLNEIKLNEHVWDQIYQTSTYLLKATSDHASLLCNYATAHLWPHAKRALGPRLPKSSLVPWLLTLISKKVSF